MCTTVVHSDAHTHTNSSYIWVLVSVWVSFRFRFACCVFLPFCYCVVCFCCVRFSFFGTKARDWLGRTSPKWHILCRVGRKLNSGHRVQGKALKTQSQAHCASLLPLFIAVSRSGTGNKLYFACHRWFATPFLGHQGRFCALLPNQRRQIFVCETVKL